MRSVDVGRKILLPKTLIHGETPELKKLNLDLKKMSSSFYNMNIVYESLAYDFTKMTKEVIALEEEKKAS